MRILAVDDDPLVLDLLQVVFREADLPQIAVAPGPREALSLLEDADNAYDCLLFDIEMPEMNGIELCSQVRTLPTYRNVPILMLTAVTDLVEIERAFTAGANDYITKPFDVKELVTRVRVAQRMVETTSRAPHLDPQEMVSGTPVGQHPFALEEPMRLKHQGQLILPFSLGNYLSQLSRTRLDTCCIFAVQIDDVEELYRTSTSQEFAIALSEVVRAISEVVNDSRLLMSYEGNGTILCILQGCEPPAWPTIEDEVLDVLERADAIRVDGRPARISLSIGNPVPPNASRNQRVKKTFDRAIGRAAMRQRSKDAPHAVRKSQIARRRTPPSPRP